VLKLVTISNDASGLTVTWQSVSGVRYILERSLDLGAQPPFFVLSTNVVGLVDTTSYTDTNAVGSGPLYYRVGVQ
jgi:hypothetical protein